MKKLSILLAVAPLLLSGCGIGPFIVDPLPPEPQKISGKKVVVAEFAQSNHQISVTNSAEIRTTLESLKARDISFQVANFLKQDTISAEARKSVLISDLKPDEVLLSGAIYSSPGTWITESGDGIGMTFNIIWMFGPGIVLPTPFPIKGGAGCGYFYEITDDKGNILFSSGERHMYGYYKNFHVYGGMFLMDEQAQKIKKLLEKEIFKELTTHFH